MDRNWLKFWAPLLAMILVGAVLFFVQAAPAPTTSADYAAWAQAVGSVLALFFTGGAIVAQIVISSRQRQDAIQAETRQTARRLAGAVAATTEILGALLSCLPDGEDEKNSRLGRVFAAEIARRVRVYEDFPLETIGDHRAIIQMRSLAILARVVLTSLGVAPDGTVFGAPNRAKAQEQLDRFVEGWAELQTRANALLKEGQNY